jgi:hypothetical protein
MPSHPRHVGGLELPREQGRGAEDVPQRVLGTPPLTETVALLAASLSAHGSAAFYVRVLAGLDGDAVAGWWQFSPCRRRGW